MSCPHHETTLLWLYGEADPAHAAHVAACPDCADVAAMHADVAVIVQAVAPALIPRRTRPRWPAVAAAAAAAAVAAGWLLASPAPVVFEDDLDVRLDLIQARVDELALDDALL
jgi:hypothetical protein